MRRSRRYSNKQSKATKSLLIYSIGTLLVILVISIVGFQLLINYSLLLDNVRGDNEQTEKKSDDLTVLFPPQFSILSSATSSSSLNFDGKSENAEEVELYINNKMIDTAEVKNDTFRFRNVKISEGANLIKTRSIAKKLKSNFSEIKTIYYREDEPALEVSNPNNGDTFSGSQITLKVTGKTESYAKVSINGTRAIMDDDGNFKHDYRMQSGENILKITTIDDVGNRVEKEVKFNYSP